MPKVICILPNASDEISGVKFSSHDLGKISDELSDEQFQRFLSIDGYLPEDASLAPKAPAVEPAQPPAKPETAAQRKARLKAEEEAAKAAEADKAAAEADAKGEAKGEDQSEENSEFF